MFWAFFYYFAPSHAPAANLPRSHAGGGGDAAAGGGRSRPGAEGAAGAGPGCGSDAASGGADSRLRSSRGGDTGAPRGERCAGSTAGFASQLLSVRSARVSGGGPGAGAVPVQRGRAALRYRRCPSAAAEKGGGAGRAPGSGGGSGGAMRSPGGAIRAGLFLV